MPKSESFARIKADVLAIARAIPPGRLTSFWAIGSHLDGAPRHVAYILATLTLDEAAVMSPEPSARPEL